jgi:hypothetical protein
VCCLLVLIVINDVSYSNMKIDVCFLFKAWIASKVKAVAPSLPAGVNETPVPSTNEALTPAVSGNIDVATGDKPTTRHRAHGRKKTKITPMTKVTTSASVASAPTNDDGDEGEGGGSSNGDDAAKLAIKRVIRAILTRQ